MSDLPLHPAVVHLPLGLTFALPIVFGWLWWVTRKGTARPQIWGLAIALHAMTAVGAFAAMTSGEQDLEPVATLVGEKVVQPHQEKGELFAYAVLAGLVVTFGGWFFAPVRLAATVMAVGVAALGLDAAHTGSQLVYQHGAANAHGAAVPGVRAPPAPAPRPAPAEKGSP